MADKTPLEQLGVNLPPDPEVEVQTNSQPEPEAPDRPDYLLDKFESVEDQARSYAEAEKNRIEAAQQRNQLEERLASLEAEREEMLQGWNQMQQPDPYAGIDPNEYLQQLYEEDPVSATRMVMQQELQALQQQAQVAQQQRAPVEDARTRTMMEVTGDLVSQRMANSYDDWEEYRPRVQEKLMQRAQQNPNENWQDLPTFQRHVEESYKLAKYEDLSERQQQGLDQADIDRQMKMSAQTLQGRSGRPDEPTPTQQLNAELAAAHGANQRYAAWAAQNL